MSQTTAARSKRSTRQRIDSMSRAFVNEDAGGPVGPRYDLPDPESDYYDELKPIWERADAETKQELAVMLDISYNALKTRMSRA